MSTEKNRSLILKGIASKEVPDRPMPHQILAGPWQVEYGRKDARVDLVRRILHLPLGANQADADATRRHELGHVRYSSKKPGDPKGIASSDAVNAVEDLRIDSTLYHLDNRWLRPPLPPELLKWVKGEVEKKELTMAEVRALAFLAVATAGPLANYDPEPIYMAINHRLPDYLNREIKQVIYSVRTDLSPATAKLTWTTDSDGRGKAVRLQGEVVRLARILESTLERLRREVETERQSDETSRQRGALERSEVEKSLEGSSYYQRAMGEIEKRLSYGDYEPSGKIDVSKWIKGPGLPEWGKMKIDTAPMPRRLPMRVRSRERRPSDQGIAIRYPHRAILDGAVFTELRTQHGGSMLIDVSGSMSLSTKDVEGIVTLAPAGIVAIYAGREVDGILRIVARKGKFAREKDLKFHFGGNVIDYPALQWLAKQPLPRLWVSDMGVTSCHERFTTIGVMQCAELCRRAHIGRVDTARELLVWLKGRVKGRVSNK